MKEYYIVSTKWTHKRDSVFTFWRPNGNGYTQMLERAGIYHEDKTNLDEKILYIEKSIIDKLSRKISGVENEFNMETFTVLPNIGEIRKELGITILDMNYKQYSDKFCGLTFKENTYEILKKVKDKNKFSIKAKTKVDEYWYYDSVIEAKNRNSAISQLYKSSDWGSLSDFNSFIDFKKLITCKQVENTVFDKWSK